MGKKEKQYRECEECGALIESGNPSSRLCKQCATLALGKRDKDGLKHRSKDNKKRKKKSKDDEYDDY